MFQLAKHADLELEEGKFEMQNRRFGKEISVQFNRRIFIQM